MIKPTQLLSKRNKITSLQQKLFTSSAILLIILVLGVWGILYPVITKTMTERFEDRFNFDADVRINDLNQTYHIMESFIIGITHNPIFKDLVNPNKSIEGYDIYAYREILNNAVAMNNIIDGVFIYFEQEDLMISNFGLAESYDLFVKSNFQFKNYSLDQFSNLFLEGNYNQVILDELTYGQKKSQVILFMTRPIVNQFVSNHARIGVIVNFDALNQRYNYDVAHPSTIILYSEKDSLISKTDFPLSLKEIDRLKEIPIEQGFVSMVIEGKEVYVRQNQVIYGMNCLILNEKDPSLVLVQRTRLFLNLFVIVIVLLGLVGVYLNIMRSIKPIKKIKHILTNVGEVFTDTDVDELRWIESNIHHIVEKEHELMEHFKTSTHSLRNFYLSRLIIETQVDSDQISFGLKLANVEFPYRFYFCTVIEGDVDKAMMMNELSDMACQCEDTKIYDLFFNEDNRLVLIINCDAHQTRYDIHEGIRKLIDATTSRTGVGSIKENLYDLHSSFQEGIKTLKYDYLDKKTSLLYYEEIKDCLPMQVLLSKDEETYLSNFLQSGDMDQALSIVMNHIDKITEKQAILIYSIKHLYIQIMLVGFRALKHQNSQLKEAFPVNRIHELNTHLEFMDYLNDFFTAVISHNAQYNKDSNNECMKNKVVDFIEAHYLNQDLSLTMVADYIGVHRVYLSKYFKEKFEVGFVEYVNRKRNERALFLLENSDIAIADIASQSGFNSEVTFRREFKRYNGISPGQYRSAKEEK
jgi:two-component system, response regulator YesN